MLQSLYFRSKLNKFRKRNLRFITNSMVERKKIMSLSNHF
jgi:hypothetical protein